MSCSGFDGEPSFRPSAFIKKLRAMSSYGKKNPYTMEVVVFYFFILFFTSGLQAKSNVPDSSRDADYTELVPEFSGYSIYFAFFTAILRTAKIFLA